jgi:hypothetical protein
MDDISIDDMDSFYIKRITLNIIDNISIVDNERLQFTSLIAACALPRHLRIRLPSTGGFHRSLVLETSWCVCTG